MSKSEGVILLLFQLFPLLAFFPLFNIWLTGLTDLDGGLYRAFSMEETKEKRMESQTDMNLQLAEPTTENTENQDSVRIPTSEINRGKFVWLCLVKYYTAPINKFLWGMVRKSLISVALFILYYIS